MTHVDWDLDVAEKGGYPDFMLKEIHEQPRVIRDTLAGRLVNGAVHRRADLTLEELNLIDRVYVTPAARRIMRLIAKNPIEGWAHPHGSGGGQRPATSNSYHHAVHPGGGCGTEPGETLTRWPPSATRA